MSSHPSASISQESISVSASWKKDVKVAQRLKNAPLLMKSATEEESDSEEEVFIHHKHSIIINRITWPHELINRCHCPSL